MSGPTAPPSRDYAGQTAEQRRADRRERLMRAGLELFGGDGYPATSIEKLCAKASVSTRNFYQEFPGREDLLIALHGRITEQAFTNTVAAVAELEDVPLADRLRGAIRAYITTTSGDPRWARIAYVEVVGVSPAVERHRLKWRGKLTAMVVSEATRAVARGEAKDRDFQLTGIAFIGAVNELVHEWSLNGRNVPIDTICAELTRLAVALLTAP
jgi:AcrR family transcriptional regulator